MFCFQDFVSFPEVSISRKRADKTLYRVLYAPTRNRHMWLAVRSVLDPHSCSGRWPK
jgi:hypothetical protein